MLTQNLPHATDFISQAGEKFVLNQLNHTVCTPKVDFCGNYKPEDGKMRIFLGYEMMNSGISDFSSLEIVFASDNPYLTIHTKEEIISKRETSDLYPFSNST